MNQDRLQQLYQAVIMEHSREPHHYGKLTDANEEVVLHNPTCGDTVVVQFQLKKNLIQALQFTGEGCAISMASASIMTDLLLGKDLEVAKRLIDQFNLLIQGKELDDMSQLGDAAALKGVSHFPARIRCAQLAWKAMEQGLDSVEAKRGCE